MSSSAVAGGGPVEIVNPEGFIEQLADAVVKRIDEREKINIIAEAVLERLREKKPKEKKSK